MDKLVAVVLDKLLQNFTPQLSFTIALSGGIDSVVLLHILNEIAKSSHDKYKLDAIHINHGISKNAAKWATFCQDICNSLNIPIKICNHNVTKLGGESLENNARAVRYKEFFNHSTDVIILAHHKTDQVETTLSQIFRGSDLHNIAGMREISHKQSKTLWRPLLDFSKKDIEEYAYHHQLQNIVDESNTDTQYLRNFIRQNILPSLVEWDKNIIPKILKTNEQIINSMALIDEIAENDLQLIVIKDNNNIDLAKFKMLSTLRQNNVLSYYILSQDLVLPSQRQISEFIRQLNTCQVDKSPRLKIDAKHEITKQKQYISITAISYFK